MIKILFICHGNICRSTMAESVMTYLVEKRDLLIGSILILRRQAARRLVMGCIMALLPS